MGDKPSQNLIEQWMDFTTGPVHYTQACDGQIDREHWPHLRMIFKRMCDKGVVEPVGGKDGMYRKVENHAIPIDWQSNENPGDSEIMLPFDLRKYVYIYPDTTIVVAGSKSSGKTGFLYRTVVMNMERIPVILLTNLEGGINMLRDRFNSMNIDIPVPAPFDVIPVYENHHDYIKRPNTLYVIDYIDVPDGESFYLIGGLIKKIDRKLQGLGSVAVIGLQKPMNRDSAFGGEQTLKTATLYIAMDSKKLKIVDAKVPTDPTVHPKNMTWTFDYDESGTNFINIRRTYTQADFQ
jgi:hypothetical protein